MKSIISIIVTIVIGIYFVEMVSALEMPLKYVKHSGDSKSFIPQSSSSVRLMIDKPSGKWSLPQFNLSQPLYRFINLARLIHKFIFYNKI